MEHNLVAVSTALYGLCDDFLSIVLLVFSIRRAQVRCEPIESSHAGSTAKVPTAAAPFLWICSKLNAAALIKIKNSRTIKYGCSFDDLTYPYRNAS